MSKTLITVPMKDPHASKTRLAGALGRDDRAKLARLLYARTLRFLGSIAAKTGADLAVVTNSSIAAMIAREAGCALIHEAAHSTLSRAASHAAAWATEHGYARLCVIPADLVAPTSDDVITLLRSTANVTICPANDLGTNALLISLPNVLPFCYGRRSSVLHMQAAQARGLSTKVVPLDSLSFDIDSSACLDRAIHQAPELAVVGR
ncbi:MAG: 2-phospho-L-lactate guanylyltransferase [Pseudomonadota bacterium]